MVDGEVSRDEQLRVNRVERFVVEQWELLRTLRLRALLADPDCFGSTLEAEQGRPEGFWRESLRDKVWFVAMDSGQLRGLVACVTVPGRDGERQLDAMWVEPATRGRGLGEALVRAVLDRARAEGVAAVSLTVADGNDAARRLYERNGFLSTGEREPRYRDPGTWHERLSVAVLP